MIRKDLVECYSMPDASRPPADLQLQENTQYPNLNSEEYRRKVSMQSALPQEFHEILIKNSRNEVLLVTNDYRRRIWSGSFWIYENIAAIGTETSAKEHLYSQGPITAIQFMRDDRIIFGNATGGLEVWEVQKQPPNSTTTGLFKMSSKAEHNDVITGVELFAKAQDKIVSTSSDCTLKIWQMDDSDLINLHTYHNAHSDSITSAACHSTEELAVTSSRDRSALLWDHRQMQPATGLLEMHTYDLMATKWLSENEICLGDNDGSILKLDRRMPFTVSSIVKVMDRPIRKIHCHNKDLIICGNSRDLFVLNEAHEIKFKTTSADWIRDFIVEEDNTVHILNQSGQVSKIQY